MIHLTGNLSCLTSIFTFDHLANVIWCGFRGSSVRVET